MRTMARFIAQLLIISLLTMNIAWAVDECAFTDPGQEGVTLVQTDDQSPDTPNAGLDCDDWCHAWVNHIALTRSTLPEAHIPTVITSGSYLFSYSSLSPPKPFHPPII
jgi:hypothetical protein